MDLLVGGLGQKLFEVGKHTVKGLLRGTRTLTGDCASWGP